jgi:uncharacterized protein
MTSSSIDRRAARSGPAQEELAATLAPRKTMVLTTFKRDGTPVGTPVTVAVEGTRIFFRTYMEAWKFKRLRRNPFVEVTPSTTLRGAPRGATHPARARRLDGHDADLARRTLARRSPILQGLLVPWAHRLLRYRTVHYELTARDSNSGAI